MKKKLVLMFSILLIVALGLLSYFFFITKVDFQYEYSGVVSLADVNPEAYKKLDNSYIFTQNREWGDFKNTYCLTNGQIPEIELGGNEKLLLVFTDISTKKNENAIYDIKGIKRYFNYLKVQLVKSGKITDIEGFQDNSKIKNIYICKIDNRLLLNPHKIKIITD